MGPFKWAIGHFTIHFIFSLLMNRFWQMKAQNDREIIQMNNIDQKMLFITNWRACVRAHHPPFYVHFARMWTHVFFGSNFISKHLSIFYTLSRLFWALIYQNPSINKENISESVQWQNSNIDILYAYIFIKGKMIFKS